MAFDSHEILTGFILVFSSAEQKTKCKHEVPAND